MTTTERHAEVAQAPRATVAGTLRGTLRNQQFILLLVLIAMVIGFTSLNPIFFSEGVFANILLEWGPIVLIAVAETFVIISGGIDLSVGATLGFSGIIAAYAMQGAISSGQSDPMAILIGVVTALLTGCAIGFINALLINRAKLVPFIATLATLGAAGGMSVVLTGGGPVAGGPSSAIALSVPWIGPFSWPVLVVILIVVIAGLYLHKSRFGRYTFAIGSNPFAALAAGINVKRHITKVYMLSGGLAGLAGMFVYIRLGSGSPTSGLGNELDAIAAVVIGGVALSGGVGRMTGTVLGALILTSVTSGLIIVGIEPDWKKVVVAALIAIAATLQALRPSNGKSS